MSYHIYFNVLLYLAFSLETNERMCDIKNKLKNHEGTKGSFLYMDGYACHSDKKLEICLLNINFF